MKENEDDGMGEHDYEESQSSGLGKDGRQASDQATNLSSEMYSALTTLASRACAICRHLCSGEVKILKYWKGYGDQCTGELDYHPSLSSLRESLDAGCPLCSEVAQSFEKDFGIKLQARDTVADSWYITCYMDTKKWCWGTDGLCFHFIFYDSDGHRVNPKLGEKDLHVSFFPAELFGLGPEYLEYAAGVTDAVSTPNTSLAQYWFNKCLNDSDCRQEARPSTIPTRLIGIRLHGNTSSDVKARLCEADDFPPNLSYLTLSHRWGGNRIFTLTKDNLETLKRDIPVHQLPDLFKDVLYMTSQLGMKYIWIDCLCILQDCQEDWAYEAARMGDIYRYAKCNIAASGYEDGSKSILKERTPLALLNYPLYLDRVLVGDKQTVGHDVRTPFKGFYIRADDIEFYNEISQGPLNSRGWVAQERALSPAILHFTPKQMWWECKNRIASEAFPYITLPWMLARDDGPNALRFLSTSDHIQDVYASWNTFAGHYAGTQLTHKSDRFPALTGIARAFGALTKDNLIAGFWEGDLIASLAWSARGFASEIPSTQLAPSWSWACLCIPFESEYFGDDAGAPPTTLCVCHRIVSDDPEFRSDLDYTSIEKSAVRGLEITGLLRKLPFKIERLLEVPEWRERIATSSVHYDVVDAKFFPAEDVADHGWHWEDPTHMLPLIKQLACRVTCLLLNRVPGAEHPNTFRRLGVVNIYFTSEISCNECLGIIDGDGKSRPSTVFEDCSVQDLILI